MGTPAQEAAARNAAHRDALTQRLTVFRSFDALIQDTVDTGYRLTLRVGLGMRDDVTVNDIAELRRAYDAEMLRLGRAERAWPIEERRWRFGGRY